jgi:S-(hydroxymethyl)glutathione dehydrogenase/alcohol dehydrogenase
MRAAVMHETKKPLVIEELDVESPKAGEVVVRIAASGVCRSDLHALEGESTVASPPMVLGHEGAGIVEEVGPGVRSVAVGDPVVIALYGPCGECHECRSGEITRCWSETRTHNMYGRMPDGTTRLSLGGQSIAPMVGSGSLAELSVVRDAQLVKIDRDIPLDLACLTGCGVTTGIGAALNVAQVSLGSTVAVIGCGGVGLNVIQGSRIAGASRIIACDTQTAKLDLAASLGATDCVHVGEGVDLVSAIKALVPAGVDYAFEVIGVPEIVSAAFDATRVGGTAIMVGSPPAGSRIAIDGRALFSDRRLLGCVGGGNIPARDIPRILQFYREGRLDLDRLVSQRLPLDRVNDAFDALRSGELARTVIEI